MEKGFMNLILSNREYLSKEQSEDILGIFKQLSEEKGYEIVEDTKPQTCQQRKEYSARNKDREAVMILYLAYPVRDNQELCGIQLMSEQVTAITYNFEKAKEITKLLFQL